MNRALIALLFAYPTGYEKREERWSPAQSIEKILISVVNMLAGLQLDQNILVRCLLFLEPNDESAANVSAAKMWRDDRPQFDRIAAQLVHKTLVDRANESATCSTNKSKPADGGANGSSEMSITQMLLIVPLIFFIIFIIIRLLVGLV